jgi:hypothetical protein
VDKQPLLQGAAEDYRRSRLRCLMSSIVVVISLTSALANTPEEASHGLNRKRAIEGLRRDGAIHALASRPRKRLRQELESFSSCVSGRPIRINELGKANDVSIFITDEAAGRAVKCGHGAGCYDPELDVIFLDYNILNMWFISRNVGTEWVSRSDDDNRVRAFRDFVFLHELGHKLGRDEEEAADEFAFQCVVDWFRADPREANDERIQPSDQSRSRVMPPQVTAPREKAALMVAEMINDADVALIYGDQTSPYRHTSHYRSFIERSQSLLRYAGKDIDNEDVRAFLSIAAGSIERMSSAARRLVADVRTDRLEAPPVAAAFDDTGFLLLDADLRLRVLSYSTLATRDDRDSLEPVDSDFRELCTSRPKEFGDKAPARAEIVPWSDETDLWLPGIGLLGCVDGRWKLKQLWRERGAQVWSDLRLNPMDRSAILAVFGPDGPAQTFEVYTSQGLTARKTEGELTREVAKATKSESCELGGVAYEYSRGTVSFRCGLQREPGICRLAPRTLGLRDCRTVPSDNGAQSGFDQAGSFILRPEAAETEYVTVFSTLDPYSPHNQPWQLRIESYGPAGQDSRVLATHDLVEERIPRGADLLQWMSVVHPPLVFCSPRTGPGLLCTVDRESAYSFNLETRTLETVFHPVNSTPVPGNHFVAVPTQGHYYILSLD